ncbi:helix-turn-helix transcriptional regulator [Bosea sp. (in: a-proteobacteria)]|uniref:helix-turn-helix domain-containing protein n=1 Tax=Bosea sp. (in: a-proteobacteria) TaxID=1871050 RepID=UPI0025BFCD08|nr:helix-turn-helix transcriptional regulator [Bosea sp. (in: a-proteobacteria)]
MVDDKPRGARKPLTAQQVRTARAWLGIDQGQLAEAVGLSRRTIASFELGSGLAYESTTDKLRVGLEALGVEFAYEDGSPVGILVRPSARSGSTRKS